MENVMCKAAILIIHLSCIHIKRSIIIIIVNIHLMLTKHNDYQGDPIKQSKGRKADKGQDNMEDGK